MTKQLKTITPSGRASIATWDFSVQFLIKEQATGFIGALLKEDINFPVGFRTELDETRTLYIVDVEGMAWAENLRTVAKLLKRFDHKA